MSRSTFADEADRLIKAALLLDASSPCVLWSHWRDKDGYGRATRNGSSFAVHRHACAVLHGPATDDKPQALHACGNGHLGCFNPHHVYWGTVSDNIDDMRRHGRIRVGRQVGGLLTDEQVREIRALRGIETQESVASRFGIARSAIARVMRGEAYRHVSP